MPKNKKSPNNQPKNKVAKVASDDILTPQKIEQNKEVIANNPQTLESKTNNPESQKQDSYNFIVKFLCGVIVVNGFFDLYNKNYQGMILSWAVAIILWPGLMELNFRKANQYQRIGLIAFVVFYIIYIYNLFF